MVPGGQRQRTTPPGAGGDSADGKHEDIPRIRSSEMQEDGADELANDGPDNQMSQHFRPAGSGIVFAQIQHVLGPKHDGQRGGEKE